MLCIILFFVNQFHNYALYTFSDILYAEYLIHNGHMNEDEAKKKFSQIVQAVYYCHQHNVVHRDLKVPIISVFLYCVSTCMSKGYAQTLWSMF